MTKAVVPSSESWRSVNRYSFFISGQREKIKNYHPVEKIKDVNER
jgi:hypothetical protein